MRVWRICGSFWLLIGFCFAEQALAPVERVWVRSKSSLAAAVPKIAPDVHSVEVGEEFVTIRSAGISLQSFGALQSRPVDETKAVREFVFRIPRYPVLVRYGSPMPVGIVGVFTNGVPIYNKAAAPSYLDRDIWHFDQAARDRSSLTPLLAALLHQNTGHSPIIGYALDGFPIYGPYGWNDKREIVTFRSSYRLP